MLKEAFAVPPARTTPPGVNATKQLELAGGVIVFHKPFFCVHVANAPQMRDRIHILRERPSYGPE